MPTYTFEHKKTGKQHDVVMPYSELDKYLSDNPSLFQVFKFGGFSGGTGKPDEGFRDILREIKKANPGSTVETF